MPIIIKAKPQPATPVIHAHVEEAPRPVTPVKVKLYPPTDIDPKLIDTATGIPAVLLRQNWVQRLDT